MLLALSSSQVLILQSGAMAIVVLVIAALLCLLVLRDRPRLLSTPDGEGSYPLIERLPPAKTGFKWRKAAPYLVFLGIIALFFVLRYATTHLPELTSTVPVAALPDPATGLLPDVDGATQAAKQEVSGYVQPSGLISKLLTMVIIFSLFSFLLWNFQKLTHPAIARWKEQDYSREFNELSSEEKFKESRGVGLGWKILAAAAIVGACFIQ